MRRGAAVSAILLLPHAAAFPASIPPELLTDPLQVADVSPAKWQRLWSARWLDRLHCRVRSLQLCAPFGGHSAWEYELRERNVSSLTHYRMRVRRFQDKQRAPAGVAS
jgi:hypothetical protein